MITLALVVAVIVIWAVVVRAAWRAWQPARLLRVGRYADAREAAERLARSWMRVFPSVRTSSRYVVGCSLHLEGDLEGAASALAPLQDARLRKDMRHAICTVEAACLLLADRDFARADALLETATRIQRAPEDILLAALAKHGLGEAERAAELFAEANARQNANERMVRVDEAIFHTLRGLYFTKVGRWTEAQRDFETAAKGPLVNVYVVLARTMLEASATSREVDSDPSSLAPQVVAKERDEPR
jgi:hypothetical protein